MATSNPNAEFESWLRKSLIACETDDDVFAPYILGILEDENSDEERRESLGQILSEIVGGDSKEMCEEILLKYKNLHPNSTKEEDVVAPVVDLEAKFSALLQNSNKQHSSKVVIPISDEQRKLKEAILAQYSQVSDGEESCGEESDGDIAPSKNTNVEAVMQAEKLKREGEKEAAQKKKDKDKEDRAKQKLKQDERKEKEKKRTQKGEKRR